MLVFYSWTFLQVINMINIKTNYYCEENAVLLISESEDIDRYKRVLERAKKNNVFQRIEIFRIQRVLSKNGSKFRFVRRKNLMSDNPIIGKDLKVFLSGFWNDALVLIDYLNHYNTIESIALVEEGIVFPSKKQLFQKVDIFHRVYFAGLFYKKYIKKIKEIYSSTDVTVDYSADVERIIMPPITPENGLCYSILIGDSKSFDDYKDCDVVYFDGNYRIVDAKKLTQFYRDIFSPFFSVEEKTIVRLHPSNRNRKILFNHRLVDVDETDILTEELSLFEDLDKKIIITINSAAATNLINIFHREPYIIFINLFYPDLKVDTPKIKIDNKKIFMPTSMNEYLKIVHEIKNRRK